VKYVLGAVGVFLAGLALGAYLVGVQKDLVICENRLTTAQRAVKTVSDDLARSIKLADWHRNQTDGLSKMMGEVVECQMLPEQIDDLNAALDKLEGRKNARNVKR
jgi:hypothetical protein